MATENEPSRAAAVHHVRSGDVAKDSCGMLKDVGLLQPNTGVGLPLGAAVVDCEHPGRFEGLVLCVPAAHRCSSGIHHILHASDLLTGGDEEEPKNPSETAKLAQTDDLLYVTTFLEHTKAWATAVQTEAASTPSLRRLLHSAHST